MVRRSSPPGMTFSIQHFAPEILGTVFEGNIGIDERFDALDALDEEILASNPRAILIDLSSASIRQYGASDALKFSERIGDKPRPLRKIAYVMRASQTDILVSAVSGLFGVATVRRFENRDEALTWLGAASIA